MNWPKLVLGFLLAGICHAEEPCSLPPIPSKHGALVPIDEEIGRRLRVQPEAVRKLLDLPENAGIKNELPPKLRSMEGDDSELFAGEDAEVMLEAKRVWAKSGRAEALPDSRQAVEKGLLTFREGPTVMSCVQIGKYDTLLDFNLSASNKQDSAQLRKQIDALPPSCFVQRRNYWDSLDLDQWTVLSGSGRTSSARRRQEILESPIWICYFFRGNG